MFLNKLKEYVKPHVLDSTPNVLSLGRRVIVDGYSFEWPAHSYSPWLVHPETGEKIHLRVKDFVPYLEVPPDDAELREPRDHDSWVAAPSSRVDANDTANMENLYRAFNATPAARPAVPGAGGKSEGSGSGASSSSGGGGNDGKVPDDAPLRSLVTGAIPGDGPESDPPLPPPPEPHEAPRPHKAPDRRSTSLIFQRRSSIGSSRACDSVQLMLNPRLFRLRTTMPRKTATMRTMRRTGALTRMVAMT